MDVTVIDMWMDSGLISMNSSKGKFRKLFYSGNVEEDIFNDGCSCVEAVSVWYGII